MVVALAPVALNDVCFRYASPTCSASELDRANREILLRVQEAGVAVPSGTTVRGQFAIRVANVSHRSRREDFDMMISAVVQYGREILGA